MPCTISLMISSSRKPTDCASTALSSRSVGGGLSSPDIARGTAGSPSASGLRSHTQCSVPGTMCPSSARSTRSPGRSSRAIFRLPRPAALKQSFSCLTQSATWRCVPAGTTSCSSRTSGAGPTNASVGASRGSVLGASFRFEKARRANSPSSAGSR
eukprot:scaffold54552_cov56-Phaeocystis_antarctica.AAC.1